MNHGTRTIGALTHNFCTTLATFAIALGGCYEGLDGEADGLGPDHVDVATEPGPTSTVTCEPTMSVFPVAAAHNIGFDNHSCPNGAPCSVSCPDAHANSDWNGPAGHHGVDVFAHADAPLVAVTEGVVTAVGTPSNTSGLRVRIRDVCGWEYYYGHMSGAAVVKDQKVVAGQLIGTMGSTGASSVHLHFNVARDGEYDDDIDPTDLLRWTSATACGALPEPSDEPSDDDDGVPLPQDAGCGTLVPGDALFVDEVLTSCDGTHALVLQGDGNAVVYEVGVGARWDTRTVGQSSNALVMQDDGNLVIYDAGGVPVWHTATHGNPGAQLQLLSGGGLVIHAGQAEIWSSR